MLSPNRIFSQLKIGIDKLAKSGALDLFIARILILGSGIISQFFVADILGPEKLGIVKVLQTYTIFMALVSSLGLENPLLKILSEGNQGRKKVIYSLSVLLTSITFVVLYLLMFLVSNQGLLSKDQRVNNLIIWYGISALPLALMTLQISYYQSLGIYRKISILQTFAKFLTVFVVVVLSYLFGVEGFVIGTVGASIINFVLFEYNLGEYKFELKAHVNDFKKALNIMKVVKYTLPSALIISLASNIDVYIINSFINDRLELGYYMFALTVLSILYLITSVARQIGIPYYTKLIEKNRFDAITFKFHNHKYIIALSVVVLMSYLMLPKLISLFSGGKYIGSIKYLSFLLLAFYFKTISFYKLILIESIGNFSGIMKINLIMLSISLPLVLIFTFKFSLFGTSIAMIFNSLIYLILVEFLFKVTLNSEK